MGGFSVLIAFLFPLDFFAQSDSIINKGAAASSQPKERSKELTAPWLGSGHFFLHIWNTSVQRLTIKMPIWIRSEYVTISNTSFFRKCRPPATSRQRPAPMGRFIFYRRKSALSTKAAQWAAFVICRGVNASFSEILRQ